MKHLYIGDEDSRTKQVDGSKNTRNMAAALPTFLGFDVTDTAHKLLGGRNGFRDSAIYSLR